MSDKKTTASYAIGVDLGTTHCALSFVDLDLSEGEEVAHEVLSLPQAVAPGELEERMLLPSFLYLPHPQELPPGAAALPWNPTPAYVVGEIARRLGAQTPLRLVSSAKSWLCHAGVDRKGAILPTDAPEEVARLSPFSASVQYLAHLRDAWNHAHPDAPFGEQDVVLTVPASFDPAARELTAEAAKAAGYHRLTLLEEPQSALYAWIAQTKGTWRDHVKVGDVILVVDVGGGTTDFSLIAVHEQEGNLALERVAVGEHILLGGDNMDLALAYVVAQKLEAQGKKLDAWQLRALTHGCRHAKEQLLGASPPESVPLVVPSRGSKLIGGSLRTELTLDEVRRTLLEGFFPEVGVDAKPATRARGALTQLGLPYAQDAAVTRHLAAFLARQVGATAELGFATQPGARFLHPTAILFNGGVFKAGPLKDRLLETVSAWATAAGGQPVRELDNAGLDLAVARGAGAYGLNRRGRGIRIRGGVARSYYVGIESAMPAVPGFTPPIKALCVVPQGTEEGAELPPVGREFGLLVGEPSVFRLLSSTQRKDDRAGMILDDWQDTIEELTPMETVLSAADGERGSLVPVRIRPAVTEIGTLEIWCESRDASRRWKLEFQVRQPDE